MTTDLFDDKARTEKVQQPHDEKNEDVEDDDDGDEQQQQQHAQQAKASRRAIVGDLWDLEDDDASYPTEIGSLRGPKTQLYQQDKPRQVMFYPSNMLMKDDLIKNLRFDSSNGDDRLMKESCTTSFGRADSWWARVKSWFSKTDHFDDDSRFSFNKGRALFPTRRGRLLAVVISCVVFIIFVAVVTRSSPRSRANGVPSPAPIGSTDETRPPTTSDVAQLYDILDSENNLVKVWSHHTLEWLSGFVEENTGAQVKNSIMVQKAGLVEFFDALSGDEWTNGTSTWLSWHTHECTWEGIGCDENLQVTSLQLAHNRLRGSLPFEMGVLTNLVKLELPGNQITGTFPSSFELLQALESVILNDNYLSGSLPASLKQLDSLQTLILHGNKLIGPLPDEFPSSLIDLQLQRNSINGTIPFGMFSKLSNLQGLYVNKNYLTGTLPPSLGNLSSLVVLEMSDNYLTGNITSYSGIASMTQLEKLMLSGNHFTGMVPDFLKNLGRLQQIELSRNKLQGSIPSSLAILNMLHTLDLSQMSLTGTISPTFSFWQQLRTLYLQENQLTGIIPTDLAALGSLVTVNLANNGLTGTIPSALGTMSRSLLELDVSDNSLRGTIPLQLCSRTPAPILVADCLNEVQCNCCVECK